MSRIQSNIGLTTGIDIQSTVNQLIAVSAEPRTRLQARVKSFQSQQIAINELTALVIGVQLNTDRIGKAVNLTSTSTTSSKPDVVAVSSSGTPTAGNYSVQTLQTAQTATASSGTFTSVSDTLQSGDFVVRTGGFIDTAASVDDLRGGAGIARGKILITDRSGNSKEVDLRFAATTEEVLKAINNTTGLRVNAKTSGDRIVLTDLSGQSTTNLSVEEVDGGRTAADLGLNGINVNSTTATGEDISFIGNSTRLSTLRDNRGVAFASGTDLSVTLRDGTTLSIDVNQAKDPTSVGQLLTAINSTNSTKLEARIKADGNGFELIDKTTGSSTFAATGKLADQLGFTNSSGVTGTISGSRVQGTLQGPLLSSLKGGAGIGTPGLITITNRANVTNTVDLSGATSLRDVIDRINGSNTGVTASLNKSRTGLVIQDVTGSASNNLVIANGDSNNTATSLNIEFNDAKNTVDSNSLGLQFVSESTELSKLNQGRGIRSGSFTITSASGGAQIVNVNSTVKTVGDLLTAINDNTINVQARLNDSGDGILITDSSTGTNTFTVADNQTGNAALDLGIRGTGTAATTGPARSEINGSQNFKLTLTGTETLTQVVEKLNQGNGPLTASILTSGPSTVRLLFTSRASGEQGRIVAEGDTVGLNVNSSGTGRDAIVAIGSNANSGGTLIRSSTNSVQNAIPGLSLNIKGISTEPVDVTVSSTNSSIEKNLQQFVDQFNKVKDKIAKETSFDSTTNATGQLFGNSEVIRVEQALSRFVNQRSFTSGRVQSLEQLGVSLDENGKLSFDKDKLGKILATNQDDVKTFLTNETNGFGVRAKKVLDTLVAEKSSVLVTRSKSLTRQIELTNKRVDGLTLKLDRERERLLKQFYDMESNIAKIKNNGSGLNQLQSLITTS